MIFKLNPFTGKLDATGPDKILVVEHSTDAVLTAADLLKAHVMDVSAGDRSFTLPSAAATDLGKWVILVRKGVANDLAVVAPAGETVLNSSSGGRVVCADTHDLASLFLMVAAAGRWTDPSFGIWSSY